MNQLINLSNNSQAAVVSTCSSRLAWLLTHVGILLCVTTYQQRTGDQGQEMKHAFLSVALNYLLVTLCTITIFVRI